MAYYKVKIDGKMYVNQHLCRVAHRIGDIGVSKAVAKGELTQKQVFDNVVYLLTEENKHLYSDIQSVQLQDIDDTIARFVKLSEEEVEGAKTLFNVASNVETLAYKGFRFVRLGDITDAYKYRAQERMAVLHICGSIYVALDAKVDTEKSPVVVTIK
jgi:hypothetical protein